jgi:hypothetical protein
MIDADYRMKRMAMGLEKVTGLTTHLDTIAELNDGSPSTRTPLARWWFTASYDAVVSDPDQNVFRFVGQGMKLLNEEVFVDREGNRTGSGRSSANWDKFSQGFSKLLPKLEEKFTVFADLHNLYDLTMVAGLIRQQGAGDWFNGSALLDESAFAIPSGNAPKFAEPVVTVKRTKRSASGDRYLNLISLALGGVSMRPYEVLGGPSSVKVNPTVGNVDVPTTLNKLEAKTDASLKAPAPAIKTGEWWADVTKK